MDKIKEMLALLEESNLRRKLVCSRVEGCKIFREGASYLNFASNDYLGLSARSDLQDEFLSNLKNRDLGFLLGATSSRLLGGDNPAFSNFENFLSEIYSNRAKTKKSALIFNSGHSANSGILPAICDSKDLVLCDKLIHASIIDSLKLLPCKFARYTHNDYKNLRAILEKSHKNYERIIIVTESVFSMDGDKSDLRELVKIKKEYGAILFVDEAHSAGVYGFEGLGLAEENALLADIDILLFTLGKAYAAQGAFVVSSPEIRELLINRCRSFIFTTASAPINILWAHFIFEKSLSMQNERENLKKISNYFREKVSPNLGKYGLKLLGESQIAPIVIGENSITEKFSKTLDGEKICAPAIRYPTVPKNSARIRLSFNADMDESSADALIDAIGKACARL